MENFGDRIAKICLEKYQSLNKTGKPTDKEWTVLSGVVLNTFNENFSVVALATGTKCLGEIDLTNTQLYDKGCRISDSHAEVLARRAFLRYLYEQIDLVFTGFKSNVFLLNNEGKIALREGISFHFFSSQTPCGDCSIFAKDTSYDYVPPVKIQKHNYDRHPILSIQDEKPSVATDIYRTGAKCLKIEEKQDPRLCGVNYHITGPLRTKPGRGNPTLSLSCSDKMAKWIILGFQGSLLSLLIPQINVETITIGGDCPFSLEAMERGLWKRFQNKKCELKIMQARYGFMYKKGPERTQPCPSSIVWCAVQKRNTEIVVEGRKQGATKKNGGSSLLISRRALFENFLITCDKYAADICEMRHPKKMMYIDWKKFSTNYYQSWSMLKQTQFSAWPLKPLHLQTFTL